MLDEKEQKILEVRNRFMNTRKVLCTGDPHKAGTIASGVKEIWPDCTFIHLSNGYNFWDSDNNIEALFKQHNTFINASYVKGVQTKLLQLCNKNMIIGDVFNIGSSHEYDNLGRREYTDNKLALMKLSLALNTFRFQTCHIVMGGIDTGKAGTSNWVKPKRIAELIKWVTEQDIKIPILGIDAPKRPW